MFVLVLLSYLYIIVVSTLTNVLYKYLPIIMIFFLGLIPVAGVIISLIALCMIAYNIGGVSTVIAVLVMITVVHALEAYILNLKFMLVKTNLPTFFTLAVLLLSEHFLGVWGLIIGIPIFICD